MTTTRRRASRGSWENDPATIRALFLAPLFQEVGKSGVDLDKFLKRYGFSASQSKGLYERVSLRQFVSLTEDVAEHLERPFLGLELGQKFALADFGPFYAMLTLSDDLRSALNRLARFQSSWQTYTTLEIHRGRETTIYRYSIQDPTIWPRRQDAEFVLASICSVIRQLTTDRWRPMEVEFEHSVTGRHARLARHFRSPVAGNRASNSMIMGNTELDRPLRWSIGPRDTALLPILERHLLDLFGTPPQGGQTCAQHTTLLVARRLGQTAVDIDSVAHEMNLSPRTLRRRLLNEGTSFRQILQEQRRTKLETILEDGRTPLAALTGRLSYSDPAVLSRAFKTWTGISLRQYSKLQRPRRT